MTSDLETERAVFCWELGSLGSHVTGGDGSSYVSSLKSLERLVRYRDLCSAPLSGLFVGLGSPLFDAAPPSEGGEPCGTCSPYLGWDVREAPSSQP